MREFQREIIENYKTKARCRTCVDFVVHKFRRCKEVVVNEKCLLKTSFLDIKIKKIKRF